MRIEVQVEEPSAEQALHVLMPKLLRGRAEFSVHNFSNKKRLLKSLPNRLKAYARRMEREDLRVMVLVDGDRQDCRTLKARLEHMACEAGLVTKTHAGPGQRFLVVNRIAVEELEAWFFGDPAALQRAYPLLPDALGAKKKFRNPDAIQGGTWEALWRALKSYGYYSAHYPKIEGARSIAMHMDPERNTSNSFLAFKAGVEALLNQG